MKKYSMLLFSLLNTVVTAMIIAFIPKEILPTHYGFSGQADTNSSKWFLMILPCILLVFSLIFIVANHFISYSENAEKNRRYIQLVFKGLYTFLFVLFWILLLISINNIQNIGSFMPNIVCIALGLLISFISNYFGKIKQNSVLGIRINATLSSESV